MSTSPIRFRAQCCCARVSSRSRGIARSLLGGHRSWATGLGYIAGCGLRRRDEPWVGRASRRGRSRNMRDSLLGRCVRERTASRRRRRRRRRRLFAGCCATRRATATPRRPMRSTQAGASIPPKTLEHVPPLPPPFSSPSLPFPLLFLPSFLPSPPLSPLRGMAPLNPARGSGGAL